jgi:hypothetical protein
MSTEQGGKMSGPFALLDASLCFHLMAAILARAAAGGTGAVICFFHFSSRLGHVRVLFKLAPLGSEMYVITCQNLPAGHC